MFEWKHDRTKMGSDLTTDMLARMLEHKNVKAINKAGMKYIPLFNLLLLRYLCPLLHLLLGLINDIMSKAIIPFALCMDGCGDEELEIHEKLDSNDKMTSRTRISLKAKLKKLIKNKQARVLVLTLQYVMHLPGPGYILKTIMVAH